MSKKIFKSVAERFDHIFSKYSERPALYIEKENREISYGELKNKINQIINIFIEKGYKKGEVCIVFNDKSVVGMASIIACTYLGIIFINLDHNSPLERLEKIFNKCKPNFLINLC